MILRGDLPTWDSGEIPLKLLIVERSPFLYRALLRNVFFVPHTNKDGTEALQDDRFIIVDVERLGRERVISGCIPILQIFRCPFHPLEVWRYSFDHCATLSIISVVRVVNVVLRRGQKNLSHAGICPPRSRAARDSCA